MRNAQSRWTTLARLMIVWCTACATVQDTYVATPVDQRGQRSAGHRSASGLIISGQELRSYASEYFGLVQITFENTSTDWIRIQRLAVDLGAVAEDRAVSFPQGSDMYAWYGATMQRNDIRDTNEGIAVGTLMAVGATVEGIGAVSRRREVAAAGGMVALGSAAALAIGAQTDGVERSEQVRPLPDSHLLALPFAVPPGLFSKRWLLLNTRPGCACIDSILLDYDVEGQGRERAVLVFRARYDGSEWQPAACAAQGQSATRPHARQRAHQSVQYARELTDQSATAPYVRELTDRSATAPYVRQRAP